jgi:hypothetical protein
MTTKIIRISANASKEDLCGLTYSIYEQLLELAEQEKRIIVSDLVFGGSFPPNSVKLKKRSDDAVITRDDSLKNMIADIILLLREDKAYRLLKYFVRTIYKAMNGVHSKNALGYSIQARAIIGMFFHGYILPAYAVWLTSDINELMEYSITSEPSDMEEYFMRTKRAGSEIPNVEIFEDLVRLRKDKKKYRNALLEIRKFIFRETLHEVYFLANEMNPEVDIGYIRNSPEKVSLLALRKKKSKECPSEWEMKKFLSKGEEGEVYRICCNENCDYVIKTVTKIEGDVDFAWNYVREKELWEEFYGLGMAPRLVESFIENSYPFVPAYYVFIMESMDVDLDTIMKKIENKNRADLLERIYTLVFSMIKKAHKNKLVHGDCHLGNFMLKATDSKIYNHLDELVDELEKKDSEVVKLLFIDFGCSISYKFTVEEILKVTNMMGIMPRLIELGCLDNVKQTPGNLLRALMYYDFWQSGYSVLLNGDSRNRNIKRIKTMFYEEMDSLKTKCRMVDTTM